ncbi:UNVERIFIED_ORG: hypothetical protein J2W85_002235 [Ensifer adhaerens]|nr:hypothetical protein [Ensifer adhaerens]
MPDIPVRYLRSSLPRAVEPDHADAAGNEHRGAMA